MVSFKKLGRSAPQQSTQPTTSSASSQPQQIVKAKTPSEAGCSMPSSPSQSPPRPTNISTTSTAASPTPDDDDEITPRPGSPAPSVLTLTDSLRSNLFAEEFGRLLNNLCVVYKLPADEKEMNRLDYLHWCFKVFCDGMNYCCPVADVLRDESDANKAILDLGCGSGLWVKEMGLEFPHCTVVGVDLVPCAIDLPDNCRVEVDDINLGLEHFYNCFDFVHTRFIGGGITDYPSMMSHIIQVLRPCGMALLMDYDYRVFTASGDVLETNLDPSDPNYAYTPVFLNAMGEAITVLGGLRDPAAIFPAWEGTNIDEFETSESGAMEFPLGPQFIPARNVEEETRNFRGILMAQLVIDFAEAAKPQLTAGGWTAEEADKLVMGVISEMRQETTERMFVRMYYVWGRKKTAQGLEEVRERAAEKKRAEEAAAEEAARAEASGESVATAATASTPGEPQAEGTEKEAAAPSRLPPAPASSDAPAATRSPKK